MGKKKKIQSKWTKHDELKANRKAMREHELENEGGWTSKHSVHKSKKNYSRKNKHKGRDNNSPYFFI